MKCAQPHRLRKEDRDHDRCGIGPVVRARSGSYRQADYLFGALVAFAGLLFLLFSPFDFHQSGLPSTSLSVCNRFCDYVAQQFTAPAADY